CISAARRYTEREFFFFFEQKTAYEFWSADVCSSDLPAQQGCAAGIAQRFRATHAPARVRKHVTQGGYRHSPIRSAEIDTMVSWRSEERRVGKECRARWAAGDGKKKAGHWRGVHGG